MTITVCDRIENSDRTGTGPDWDHFGWNRTGTGPEPDRITSLEKVDRIRPDWPDRLNWPDFYRIFKTLMINLQVKNVNLLGSFNFEI